MGLANYRRYVTMAWRKQYFFIVSSSCFKRNKSAIDVLQSLE